MNINELRAKIVKILNEDSVNDILELSKKYPYGYEAVKYYIFNDNDPNNKINLAKIGAYSDPIYLTNLKDYVEQYKFNWKHNLGAIDSKVRLLIGDIY